MKTITIEKKQVSENKWEYKSTHDIAEFTDNRKVIRILRSATLFMEKHNIDILIIQINE